MTPTPPTVTCDALDRYFPDGKWAARVQPLPGHGLVYVKNAKVATSVILLWLYRIHSGRHDYDPAGSRPTYRTDLPSPEDVGLPEVARMLDGGAFRFSFVRDPYRRLESAYLSKLVRATDGILSRRVVIQRTLGLPKDRAAVPTFDQFLAALELQEPLAMDQHWRPQHLNLMHGLVEYDVVGRLESFDADLERIRAAAGLPRIPVGARNKSGRDVSLFEGRPDLRRRVETIYARDFELYGY